MIAPLGSYELVLVEEQARELARNGATKPVTVVAAGQALLKMLEFYRAALRVPPAEERAAWDRMVASCGRGVPIEDATRWADKVIAARRERFGGPR